ncbi:MAG: sulfotransferase domain-containing protein [Chitinophagales bacterium]|nr:sulfotransferase domain-containing protein [Chitinophagaceae bacterium]MBP9882512.1 sulfotransferase domain-containing protein [Chitinophagales bacterium]
MPLPNFLLVGAGKSATRSLYNYMIQHPDVYMPKFKEPQFFVAKEVKNRIQKWVEEYDQYVKLFDGADGKKAIGEASVMYLFFYEEAIRNIQQYLGSDVKIMMILRHPAERAYSAYNFVRVNNPDEKYSFEQAMEKENERFNQHNSLFMQYRPMGLYASAVQAYLSNFRNVHIMWYDEFRKDPAHVLRGVFEFLGVNPDVTIDYTKRWNQGGKQWKNPLLRWLFMSDNPVKKMYKIFFRKRKGVRTNEFFTKNFMESTEPMDPATRSKLVDYYRNDIEQLSAITGRNLDDWLK